jgi:NitT/TauT family transport system substrate-binding protein
LYVAAELLPGEGFTEVQYIKTGRELFAKAVAAGEVDIALNFSGPLLTRVEAGDPLVILAGGHVGCFELFGTHRVHAIRDLKGKAVGVVAFPPQPQEPRAKGIGHVMLNSSVDRPWSQYFCCLVYANRGFVRTHPVATKRVLCAILKAADLCALAPDQAARTLVDRGFTPNYDYAFQTMKDVPYAKWREYEPEDTVRFYAFLQEAGMIKSPPQKMISQGTDWRFWNEFKRELKG